jgi:hypothetical protein
MTSVVGAPRSEGLCLVRDRPVEDEGIVYRFFKKWDASHAGCMASISALSCVRIRPVDLTVKQVFGLPHQDRLATVSQAVRWRKSSSTSV